MPTLPRPLAVVCVVLSACGAEAGSGQDASRDRDSASNRFATLERTIEQERADLGVSGVAVAIVEDGVVTYSAGFGVRARGEVDAVTPMTIFPIGSVTKPLTALGLLRLVDQGAVDLDAPVLDYVPQLSFTRSPEALPSVTVRHLLTQSSGLPDQLVAWSWPDTDDSVLDSYLTGQTFADTYSLMFPPGRMYFYSNLGFDLLGLIAERVSGRMYPDYMRDEVFARLGMTRATFRSGEVLADGNYAIGEMDGRDVSPLQEAPPWQRPSGLAYASVLDLAEFARFLSDGDPDVLSAELRSAMLTPQLDTHVHLDRIQQGLGVVVSRGLPTQEHLRDYDLTVVSHGGVMMGYTAYVLAIPERRFAFVFAANRHSVWFDRSAIAALTTLLGLPEAPLAVAPEDPSAFAEYAGMYTADTGKPAGSGEVTVTADETGLHMTLPLGGGTCDMEPLTVGNFHCPNGYPFPLSTMTFLRDARGEVEYLRAIGLGFSARRDR